MSGGPIRSKRRRAYPPWLLWALLGLVASGCVSVRRFLVPPPSATGQQPVRQAAVKTIHAELLLIAAAVHGVPGARAVAIRAGQVMAVGTPLEISATLGPSTQMVSVPGAVIMLGLVDAHVHLQGAAQLRDAADLSTVNDEASLRAAVQAAAATADEWLWGFGLSQQVFASMPASAIEAALEGKAAYLSRADGHGARVTEALIDSLPKPLAAQVAAADGRIDEVLAQQVWRELPPLRPARLRPLLRQTLMDLQRQGITEVHAMGEPAAVAMVLTELDHEGRLPMRVRLYLDLERSEGRRLLDGTYTLPNKGLLDVAGVKVWLDGTLGARTAALSQPYSDDPSTSGRLLLTDSALQQVIERADRRKLQVAVHAIGDAAVGQVVRVLQGMKRPERAKPVRIEHAQVVSPEQMAALATLAVECSIQPRHAAADHAFAAARLGRDRLSWSYRGLELAKVCNVRSGSDMPVLPAGPIADWRALLKGPGGATEQAQGLALAAITAGGTAAVAASIASGTPADLVVWSADPRKDAKAKPLWVVLAGSALRLVDE